MIRFGACKTCEALQQEVAFLRSLVRPPVNNSALPIVHIEQDAVLSGKDEQTIFTAKELEIVQEQQREATAVLSGQHENF